MSMPIFKFDQKGFMKEVFAFIKTNEINVRDFAKAAKISPTTLYRLSDGRNEITFTTIIKMQKAMVKFTKLIPENA